MAITNLTKKTKISTTEKTAKSFPDKMFGLLNKSNPRTMVFYTRFGIHTLFMGKPIDVLVLDNQFKVVGKKVSLQPNEFFFYSPKYKIVIEMPEGKINETKTSLNDKISISHD